MKSKFIQGFLALALTCVTFSITSAATDTVKVYSTYSGQTVYGQYNMGTVNINNTNQPILTSQPVLNTATGTSCTPFITKFNKLGDQNQDVANLQNFLNQKFGTKLNGKGYYGPVTKAFVQDLQYTYGIPATGNQFQRTTILLNDLNCGIAEIKALKNYVAPKTISYVNSTGISNVPANIIPSPSKPGVVEKANNLVKEYANNNKIPAVEGKVPTNAKVATSTATQTSFFQNLEKDWAKIKENYKAYLLVFALVLALFWFLRKAATE